jgi:hypothetical protein
MEVKVEINLVKNSNGELAGAFGNPTQNLKGLPLANVAVDSRSVTFQIKGSAPGERLFKAAVSADGTSMSGEYAQEGYSIPFTVTRTGDARIEPPAKSAAIASELEGTWNGTLDVNGMQMRIVLKLANQPDGSATGSLANLDQGALEVPIAAIAQKGPSVTLDVTAVGGSYSGALNPEVTEMAGTWSQGTVTLPPTLRRAR